MRCRCGPRGQVITDGGARCGVLRSEPAEVMWAATSLAEKAGAAVGVDNRRVKGDAGTDPADPPVIGCS